MYYDVDSLTESQKQEIAIKLPLAFNQAAMAMHAFSNSFVATLIQQGESAAMNGMARDWSMPDPWHRGYLAGLRKKKKGGAG